MDSLTQIVLGAAVGELVLGKKLGNKAMLLGAIAGTVPDLDVVFSWFNNDPVEQLRTHRSYSHSMFFHFILAIPFTYFSYRWSKASTSFNRWYVFWYLGFFTHALLDCCTTYGTRLLLPFTDYQVAFNNISVIDPLYTLPFMLCLIVAMFYKRGSMKRKRWVAASLWISCGYMLASFALKAMVHHKFKQHLVRNNIPYTELNTTPTMLNAILWSAVAYSDSVLYSAEYSFLRPEVPIVWSSYKINSPLLEDFKCRDAETVKWFSDGNYFIEKPHSDTLNFFIVKWGKTRFDKNTSKETFMFYYTFYRNNKEVKCIAVTPKDFNIREAFTLLLDRIGV